MFLCGHVFPFLLGVSLGLELPDQMVTLFSLGELMHCFPSGHVHFPFSPGVCGDSDFSTPSPTCLFDSSRPCGCDGVRLWFCLAFSSLAEDVVHLFISLLAFGISSLEK